MPDSGSPDSGEPLDAGADAGVDAGTDSGVVDSGFDAGFNDAGFDAGMDAGSDAGTEMDAGFDAGTGRTIFVITGQDQRRMISFDGTTWEHDVYIAPNGLDDAFGAVTIANRLIVIAGDPGLWTSTDGINWTPSSITQSLHGAAMVYGGGYFVLVKSDFSMRSADGLNWTTSMNNGDSGHWQSIAYGNGHYVAFGDGHQKTSEDGLAWHDYTATADPDPFDSVAFGNGVFVAVGKKNNTSRIATSTDGVTFTDQTPVATSYMTGFAGIAFGNGKFVTNDCCNVFESTDGVSWTKRGRGYGAGIVFAAGTFVAAGWRTQAYLYDEDAGAFSNTFGGDQPNDFVDGGIAPWFTGLGAGEIN